MAADLPEVDNDLEPARPARLSRLTRWLIAIGMGVLFVALNLVSATIRDTSAPLATALVQLQATLTAAPQPLPARDQIAAAMILMRQNAVALNSLTGTLTAQHITWPDVLNLLADYDASQVYLSGLAQSGMRIVVTGQAADENVVINYTDRLRQSNRFSSVVVQSITLKGSSGGRGSSPFPGRDQYADFMFTIDLAGTDASS